MPPEAGENVASNEKLPTLNFGPITPPIGVTERFLCEKGKIRYSETK